MATFISGKTGLIEDFVTQRDRIRPETGRNKTERAYRQGQVATYNMIIGWLQSSDVHVLTEEQFAAQFGPDPRSPAELETLTDEQVYAAEQADPAFQQLLANYTGGPPCKTNELSGRETATESS